MVCTPGEVWTGWIFACCCKTSPICMLISARMLGGMVVALDCSGCRMAGRDEKELHHL